MTQATPKPSRENIVVTGTWNPAILHPRWLVENQCIGPVEMKLSPLSNGYVQFSGDGCFRQPQPDRLVGGPLPDGKPERAVAFMERVLTILEHTPVSAIGLNFGYDFSRAGDEIAESIAPPSALADIVDEHVDQELDRSFVGRWRTPALGVMMLTLRRAKEEWRLDFNFHHDVARAKDAVTVLTSHDQARRTSQVVVARLQGGSS